MILCPKDEVLRWSACDIRHVAGLTDSREALLSADLTLVTFRHPSLYGFVRTNQDLFSNDEL